MRRSANIAMSARSFTARRRSIVCCFRSLRKGSRAARRRFTLSIRSCATSTYSDFPQAASTSLPSRRMDNSSCTIGMKFICATVISTGTECLPACRTYWSRASATASPSPASWATPNELQVTGLGETISSNTTGVRTSLFFPAILLSTWFGGTGPGLLAVLLSILSINFFFTEPFFAFEFSARDIPTTIAFLFSALVISSWSTARKRSETRLRESESELRKARNHLEAKVEERTAKLLRSNEELQEEIAERKSAEEKLRHSEAFLTEGHRSSHTAS